MLDPGAYYGIECLAVVLWESEIRGVKSILFEQSARRFEQEDLSCSIIILELE